MFTLAFGSEFLIWFSTMETVLYTVKGKMRLDMVQPWARPLFMVWVTISQLSSLHVSSCPALKRTAHHFHTFLSRASISHWMASPLNRTVGIFHIDTAHGSVSVDGDVGRDDFVEWLWALFHSHSKLVWGKSCCALSW